MTPKGGRLEGDWKGFDEVRSMLVAMEIATGLRFGVFARTPSLMFVLLALIMAASARTGNESTQRLQGLWDVANTSYHAEINELVHVVPPKGADHRAVVWQLGRALYGTRVASNIFQALIIKVLTERGEIILVKVMIMVFWRVEPATKIALYGDDFLGAGSRAALESVNHLLQSHMEGKRAPYIGA